VPGALVGNDERPPSGVPTGGVQRKAGGDVLSHRVSPAVPSALRGLTTVFGMGTGVALSLNHQPKLGLQEQKDEGGVLGPGSNRGVRHASFSGAWCLELLLVEEREAPVKPHGQLVRLGCAAYAAYTCRLSTW